MAAAAATIGCSGYVAESVPIAIFAAQKVGSQGFRGLIESVVSVGGDTDTTASIAGQIAGAWVGYGDLPEELVERLPQDDFDVMWKIAGTFAARLAESDRT